NGTDWDADGGPGISDPEGWTITALASWNFWEWGRTTYGKNEKLSRLAQAELQKTGILDSIHLEVKNAYNRTQEAEKAIVTIEKAIEQAKENFRINEERYKEQMATSTDVLIAQTLLSRTMTNYYNALYAFKKAKASLYRAIGREVMQ
ncbi:MAG: TolC family protein, partial [Deltaproteobacteria bacterium]|nr:TolC family protein [Deltaproteobacteria bacterium]